MTAAPTGSPGALIPFPRRRGGRPVAEAPRPASIVPFPLGRQRARSGVAAGPRTATLAPLVELAAYRSSRDKPTLDPAA